MNSLRRSEWISSTGEAAMNYDSLREEAFVEKRVIYHIEVNGQLILVENVPARINVDAGEWMFAPQTVQHLQEIAD